MAKEESTAQAEPVKEAAESMFSGSQLIRAASGVSRDIMATVLVPDRQYTETDAKSAVDKFLKKEVSGNGGR